MGGRQCRCSCRGDASDIGLVERKCVSMRLAGWFIWICSVWRKEIIWHDGFGDSNFGHVGDRFESESFDVIVRNYSRTGSGDEL